MLSSWAIVGASDDGPLGGCRGLGIAIRIGCLRSEGGPTGLAEFAREGYDSLARWKFIG